MMKMRAALVVFCVLLVLGSTPVSSIQRLYSIQDLNIYHPASTDTRRLLQWFAKAITIDRNDRIRLNFNRNNGDYGSHHYGNFEQLLDPLPDNIHQYYTLGNTNENSGRRLPGHITGGNRARIIVRLRLSDNAIDRVYITQHYGHIRSDYNPDHTYQVTTSLLRQMSGWGTECCETFLKCIGFALLFLVVLVILGGSLAANGKRY